jgi:hypothetical protein
LEGGAGVSIEVVGSYHKALSDRDFGAARDLLKGDMRFTGPFDEFDTTST